VLEARVPTLRIITSASEGTRAPGTDPADCLANMLLAARHPRFDEPEWELAVKAGEQRIPSSGRAPVLNEPVQAVGLSGPSLLTWPLVLKC
jgi:hypothetical protein